MLVQVVDRNGVVVGSSAIAQDTISIQNANFWWPYTMNNLNPGYLYTLKVGTFNMKQVTNFVISVVMLLLHLVSVLRKANKNKTLNARIYVS